VTHERRAQVVTAAEKRLRSYDLETGDIVWESDGLTMNPIPSPVAVPRINVLSPMKPAAKIVAGLT